MILGVLECLGVGLPLDVVELSAEFVPKVCSGYWPRPEGTHATDLMEFAQVLLVPFTSSVGQMFDCSKFNPSAS